MHVEIVMKEDLHSFRVQLMSDIREILSQSLQPRPESIHGYKTADVRKILGCSVNKLVSLGIKRNLRTKKIGGTLYYNKDDIKKWSRRGIDWFLAYSPVQ